MTSTVSKDKFENFYANLYSKFAEKGVSDECPYCHSRDWLLMDWERNGTYIKPLKNVSELGNSFMMLTCSNCGNIRFIDPYVLGILEDEE